jgi:adenylate cyclase
VADAAAEGSGKRLVDDIWRRLSLRFILTGVLGGVVVFQSIGILIPLFLDADERDRLGLIIGPILAVYFVVAGVVVLRAQRRSLIEATRWIVEDRAPSAAERRLALRQPLRQTQIAGFAWTGGILLSNAVQLALKPGFAAVTLPMTILGGWTTGALIYLLSERALRPVTARALAVRQPKRPVAPSIRQRLVIAWAVGTGVPVFVVLVVGIVGVSKSNVDVEYVAVAAIFLGLVALSVGLTTTFFASRAIADPVTSVRHGLEEVERGNLDAQVSVDDGSEVGLLQAGFNRMASGLREREQIRDLFGRQVGRDVARAALRDGTKLGGEEREVAALFVDLTGSTSMAVRLPPAEVVRTLNLFFRVVVEVVEVERGHVNKFEGDAALCVFGAPLATADPAGDALRAARALSDRLARESPELDFGIGVSAGAAVAGNVGAEERFEYTVIGDPVNEAARLCDLAKERGIPVLASEAALARAGADEAEAWKLGESTVLRGRDAPTGLAVPSG